MRTQSLVAAVVSVLLCAACAHRNRPGPSPTTGQVIPSLASAAHVYTLTDLHPDEERMILYTANFQQPGLIPICSEITFVERGDDWMKFKVKATGKEYEYASHEASAEPFVENLERYFGAECPTLQLDTLTPDEREAVRTGTVVTGMRKEAVILAIGYPPRRDTPSLDKTMWMYWRSRARSFYVEFDKNGKVVKVY